ncbi:MAG: OmpA family protein [Bacteroidales bacterium]|nr:OmpA family protein [Bacteroidales bacterium]
MKKLFLLIASALVLVPATSFAQEITRTEDENTVTFVEETQTPDGKVVTTTIYQKNSVFTNGFWHNWTLGVGLGTQLYYGDNDWKVAKKTEMLVFPAIDLYLTKWASPSFGVGLGANWAPFKGLYQSNPLIQNKPRNINANFRPDKITLYNGADSQYASQQLAYQEGSYLNLFALAHADIGNIFFGYKPDRVFDIDAYAGGGVIYGFSPSGNIPGASFNCGLNNMIRLADRLHLLISVRGALVSDDFDGECYMDEPSKNHWLANHKLDGILGVTGGLTWKIGKEASKWNLASRSSTIYYNDVIRAEKERLQKALAEAQANPKEVYVEKIVKDIPEVWWHINFIVDRWDLLTRELVNLQAVSDLMKSTPHTKYLLCGYADKQTATPEHNLMLSKNRVESVYNALVNQFGVNPDQLVTDYKGGVDYMFYNEKELSRCCMITSIKEEE